MINVSLSSSSQAVTPLFDSTCYLSSSLFKRFSTVFLSHVICNSLIVSDVCSFPFCQYVATTLSVLFLILFYLLVHLVNFTSVALILVVSWFYLLPYNVSGKQESHTAAYSSAFLYFWWLKSCADEACCFQKVRNFSLHMSQYPWYLWMCSLAVQFHCLLSSKHPLIHYYPNIWHLKFLVIECVIE